MLEAEEEHTDKEDDSFCNDADDEYDINDDFVDDTATSSWLMDDENYDTEIVSHQLLLARQRKNSSHDILYPVEKTASRTNLKT